MEGAGAPLEFALAERPHDLLAIAAVLLDQLRSPLAGEPGFANKKIHLVVSAGGELNLASLAALRWIARHASFLPFKSSLAKSRLDIDARAWQFYALCMGRFACRSG